MSHLQSILPKYYQSGDLIYGASILRAFFDSGQHKFTKLPPGILPTKTLLTENYQHILALAFAVKEINQNPHLLPNITLGFNIYDNYLHAWWASRVTVELISSRNRCVPNYKCDSHDHLLAVIEELTSTLSDETENLFRIYKIPQLRYGSSAVDTKDARFLPIYQMVPNGRIQFRGIIQLLQHFKWKWIAFLAADEEILEWFLRVMLPEFLDNGICLELFFSFYYDVVSSDYAVRAMQIYNKAMNFKANVTVAYGSASSIMLLRRFLSQGIGHAMQKSSGCVWILTVGMELKFFTSRKFGDEQAFHSALSFAVHSTEIQGFAEFIQSRHPSRTNGDGFMKEFWREAFGCTFQDSVVGNVGGDVCTEEEKLENLPEHVFPKTVTSHSYSIYNAVYAVAHALHAMYSSTSKSNAKMKGGRRELHTLQSWQLHHFLPSVSFNNSAGEKVFFNQDWEAVTGFDIINWVSFPNQSFFGVKVGRTASPNSPDETLIINEDLIVWHSSFNQVQPSSVCSAKCQAGYRKKRKEGEMFCCYDCIQCPKGWVSGEEDMAYCARCPDDHYPNKDQNSCVPKRITFLSYEEPLGITLAIFALSLVLITSLVLGIFMKYHNTPIVKANNQDLTYTLLISLLLCFLCTLLFVGQPETATCILQRITFDIIFTVTLSTVLAKTITVVLAFKATQPGSRIKKWVGKKLASFIILACSTLQVTVCLVWLVTSPPFPDTDIHSLPEEIILWCNASSFQILFSELSFTGLIAFISITVAFFARKLPDGFNESTLITFSMVVLCSIWMCFVPVYLTAKGKHTVAFKMFIIIASNAGLLGSFFFPKCYIILLKPELNSKEQLRRRMKL
ncbi:vomeronasal type-2 receptor 26-like [Pogona vitticeps]